MKQQELKLEISSRYLIGREGTKYINKKDVKFIYPEEVIVLEFSPSNIYVKLQSPTAGDYDDKFSWEKVDEIKIMEQLQNNNEIPF
jgi:hypothetical protein